MTEPYTACVIPTPRWDCWLALTYTHGKANGHQCADVGAALKQFDGKTGVGEVGWVNDDTLSTSNTGNRNV